MEMIENLWCQLTEEDKEHLRRGYEESIEFLEELKIRIDKGDDTPLDF